MSNLNFKEVQSLSNRSVFDVSSRIDNISTQKLSGGVNNEIVAGINNEITSGINNEISFG